MRVGVRDTPTRPVPAPVPVPVGGCGAPRIDRRYAAVGGRVTRGTGGRGREPKSPLPFAVLSLAPHWWARERDIYSCPDRALWACGHCSKIADSLMHRSRVGL